MRAFKGYMRDYEIVYKQDRTFFKVKLYSKEQNNCWPEVPLASFWQFVSFSSLDKFIFSFWFHSVGMHNGKWNWSSPTGKMILHLCIFLFILSLFWKVVALIWLVQWNCVTKQSSRKQSHQRKLFCVKWSVIWPNFNLHSKIFLKITK